MTIESTSDYWRIWFYLMEGHCLDVQLVNAREAKHTPGRPKADKLDSVWLAKLTEKGLLRPSFVPPHEIRVLRDYTRMRTDLTRERTRYRVTAGETTGGLADQSVGGGQLPGHGLGPGHGRGVDRRAARSRALAELARGRMKHKHSAGGDADGTVRRAPRRTGPLTADRPAHHAGGTTPHADHLHPHRQVAPIVRPIAERLDEIPGIGALAAQVIIAEVGLDMTRFPTADHLVSWAKLSPRTIQSGDKNTSGKIGKGNPHLKGVLGQAAAVAARTDTFLGERFRRIVKRRGKLRALVAVARSLLVVIWHLLADPTATSTTWDRTTTSADWTPAERYAPTSGNWKPSGSTSP
ncbi:transposase [Microbispora amethystogenes]|uniref:IS110 family transposase n=1 Tax=Microbispora amethystogenes TaxID=1427754 RepID=A0ABQ4FD33_9ACTN|nr:transposase [Microbispora amethystogenes]GIH32731.1 IS110 family transposase [Microbispora amethystogenes]